ncbi:MAG: hypothetical protein NC548_66185 [Lachnospiraceae bacterium]|nr:hypothetical protein [Lachnospiraceae bacterium]
MKKFLIPIVILLLLFCTACSNANATEDAVADSNVIESQKKDDKTDNSKSGLNSDIEQIYITVLDGTFKVDVSEKILKTLELSKSAVEPVLDEEAMINTGKIQLKYTDNDTPEEFGEVYINDSMDLYIKSNENKNNAVIKIDFDLYQNSSDDESNMESFEPFYKSLFN